jgi:sulfite reductase (NADPH) flavoprotein alpha-component
LTRLDLAFSRDQAEKVYVQHRLREHGAELCRWLEGGAYIYVCGDAKNMAGDVETALVDVLTTHGGLSAAGARNHLKELRRAGRYQRDVY